MILKKLGRSGVVIVTTAYHDSAKSECVGGFAMVRTGNGHSWKKKT